MMELRTITNYVLWIIGCGRCTSNDVNQVWFTGIAGFFIQQMTLYKELYKPAVISAGCSVLLALFLSIFLIIQHLRSYTNPAEQKWIVGVVLMVPVYASESIMSLSYPKTSLACDILRNCYEAFALYAFGSYLIACLGGEERVIQLLEDESREVLKKPLLEGSDEKPVSHPKFFCSFFLQPSALGKDLFSIIKFGLVQYMILKTACAFLAFLLEIFGVYGDGEFEWYHGYPYITVVLNFSQMWALYCLVQFYNVTHDRLKPIRPLAKFISFKAIVFATWWQGVGIALFCTLGVLPKEGKFQTALQDFLICIEMLIAAIAHVYVFSAKPYHYISPSLYAKLGTRTEKIVLNKEDGKDKGPTMIEKTKTEVKAPGTSISESVQDIFLEGGQQVVEDVKLTINQAMEPVEKGVMKIQESFHHITVGSDGKQESDVEIEEHVKHEHEHEHEHEQPGDEFKRFHHITVSSDGKQESGVEIEEHIKHEHEHPGDEFDRFHHVTVGSDGKQELDVEIKEHFERDRDHQGCEFQVVSEQTTITKDTEETSR